MKLVSMIAKIVLIVFIAALVILNGWIIAQKLIFGEEMPRVFGYSQAVVISGSMEPELQIDDLVVAREKDFYETGDIIMFRSDGSIVTHRIIAETDGGYVTKGDANNIEDDKLVAKSDIYGAVVYKVQGVGKALSFIRTPLGTVIIIAAGVLLFLLLDIFERISAPKKKIRRPKHR